MRRESGVVPDQSTTRPMFELDTATGTLRVRFVETVDDDGVEQLRALVDRLPAAVPMLLELGDGVGLQTAELGSLLSIARTAKGAGRPLAISAPLDDLRERLQDIGVGALAFVAATIDECDAHLAAAPRPTS